MKHLIIIAVALFLSSCIMPYAIDPGQPDVRQIDGQWYVADGWRIVNQTGQPVPIPNVHTEYFDSSGNPIHAHDLTCPGQVEPYGEMAAHPAQVYKITAKQAQLIAQAQVTVTERDCPS